jgi:hypothetical protein
MFVVQGYQRPKARDPKEIQVTEIKDQRCLPPRDAADRFAYPIGIGGVNFATDAHHRGKVVRVHAQPGPCTIE